MNKRNNPLPRSTKKSRNSTFHKLSAPAPTASGGKYQLIWEIVKKIPRGRVASYGAIAGRVGLAGHARLVGYALHNLPHGFDIPWHRVINVRGKISFPKGSRIHNLQRKLLEQEGIRFIADRVAMSEFGWP